MIAAVFPGQSSQRPGMGQELFLAHPEARHVFHEAANATGIDLEQLCFESDEETLRRTDNTQIALFVCSVAAYRSIPAGIRDRIGAMAGHSVGEYAALVCSGILDVATGARLVQRRGTLMAVSGSETPGTMAAILGLDRSTLQKACENAGGVVVIANDNCPGQLVISGTEEAVQRAGNLAAEAGAKRVMALNVSGAFHSPLMHAPAEALAETLGEAAFATSPVRVYSNVTSEPETANWPSLLQTQLESPVRWTESVEHMIRDGVDVFIECGVGEVLSGLIRRINRDVTTLRVNDNSSLANTIHDLE